MKTSIKITFEESDVQEMCFAKYVEQFGAVPDGMELVADWRSYSNEVIVRMAEKVVPPVELTHPTEQVAE